jgi:hypothetical protein
VPEGLLSSVCNTLQLTTCTLSNTSPACSGPRAPLLLPSPHAGAASRGGAEAPIVGHSHTHRSQRLLAARVWAPVWGGRGRTGGSSGGGDRGGGRRRASQRAAHPGVTQAWRTRFSACCLLAAVSLCLMFSLPVPPRCRASPYHMFTLQKVMAKAISVSMRVH